MPIARIRKCSKLELIAKDVWTEMSAAVSNKVGSDWRTSAETKEQIQSARKSRKQCREGELQIMDADSEELLSDIISKRARVLSSEQKE